MSAQRPITLPALLTDEELAGTAACAKGGGVVGACRAVEAEVRRRIETYLADRAASIPDGATSAESEVTAAAKTILKWYEDGLKPTRDDIVDTLRAALAARPVAQADAGARYEITAATLSQAIGCKASSILSALDGRPTLNEHLDADQIAQVLASLFLASAQATQESTVAEPGWMLDIQELRTLQMMHVQEHARRLGAADEYRERGEVFSEFEATQRAMAESHRERADAFRIAVEKDQQSSIAPQPPKD